MQLEVQDTVPPPSYGVMRKACHYAMAAALGLYMTVAVIGCELWLGPLLRVGTAQ